MTGPTVCAVMLTANRPEMARRAAEAFQAQTYQRKSLLVLDTGELPAIPEGVAGVCVYHVRGQSIGALRNTANGHVGADADILIHWDDDDWSHPNRIAEQVAHLQASGAGCVGYNEMIFWKEQESEAWLYTSGRPDYCLGTSMCYWRETWQRHPFHDGPKLGPSGELLDIAEDLKWQMGVKCESVSALSWEPLMIASVHGRNTLSKIQPALTEWKRVSGWDSYCQERMAL